MERLAPRGGGVLCSFVAFVLWAPSVHAQAADKKLADYFGFQPLELYKLDNRIGNLHLKDLDGDKVDDIIVTNNGRSRIDLLLSTKKAADDKASRPFRKDPNELEYDRRMRLVSIPVNKEVVSVDTGDFNGDGKPDLVFYGTPAEVEILFNEGKGRLRQSQEDQYRRRRTAAGGAGRGGLRPGRPRRPGPAGGERIDLRLSDRRRGSWASRNGRPTPPAVRG